MGLPTCRSMIESLGGRLWSKPTPVRMQYFSSSCQAHLKRRPITSDCIGYLTQPVVELRVCRPNLDTVSCGRHNRRRRHLLITQLWREARAVVTVPPAARHNGLERILQ
jgi:hypothetical protein